MRGSKPGERRGGRKAGTPNKSTAEIKAAARLHGDAALKRLAHLLINAESEMAQITAAKELLDRGYGRTTQLIGGDDEAAAIRVVNSIKLIGPG